MENLLLAADGTVKLCDFGSATTKCYYPDIGWSANQRGLVEEEVGEWVGRVVFVGLFFVCLFVLRALH